MSSRRQAVTLKNGAEVTIRPLATADGEALARFYESVPDEDYRFYRPHPLTRERALQKAAQADNPNFVCLVAETEQHEIAGYTWYRWKAGDSKKSTFGICIRTDFQSSGVGALLLRQLLSMAETVGPPVMSLTVQKANPRAIALYKKMGFEVVRAQVRSDGEPEYYMERRVR